MKAEALSIAAVVAVVVAIGAVPIYMGGSLIRERLAYGGGIPASADVVTAERLWLRDLITPFKRKAFEVTYEFRTPKGPVRSTGIYTQSSGFSDLRPGSKLQVLYLPEDPARNYLDDYNKLFDAAWYIGLGLLAWLAAGVFAWLSAGRSPRK
jgi:hypothetical protein